MYDPLSNSCTTNNYYGLPSKNNVLGKTFYNNIPATEVLEEMYKALNLDIPPVYTFRQETTTQKFFCSAGFINCWYDTRETFSDIEEAKEVAAQNLLNIIMSSEEYKMFLRVL